MYSVYERAHSLGILKSHSAAEALTTHFLVARASDSLLMHWGYHREGLPRIEYYGLMHGSGRINIVHSGAQWCTFQVLVIVKQHVFELGHFQVKNRHENEIASFSEIRLGAPF